MKDNKPGTLKIILCSIVYGTVASSISAVIISPIVILGWWVLGSAPSETIYFFRDHMGYFYIFFSILLVFEVLDRIIKGVKRSKIMGIIRDKEDRAPF